MFFDQHGFDVRCEWGSAGIEFVATGADLVIIVDVLSFSTCVDLAVSRGAKVFPYRWKDETAREFASSMGAALAAPRGQSGGYSLSPESFLTVRRGTRVVLPSPNGAELTSRAAALGRVVLTGCLRNCRAVARYAAAWGGTIAVIPAGERWPDQSLRPAFEDLAAAGAILSSLHGNHSPESQAAVAVWDSVREGVDSFIAACASGRELIDRNFATDVMLASEVDVSGAVPVLRDGAYVNDGPG